MTDTAAQRGTAATPARPAATASPKGAVRPGAILHSTARTGSEPGAGGEPEIPGPDAARRQPSGETSERAEWRAWLRERTEAVAAPYGPLSVTGTHWLADAPDGRLPGVPGRWTEDGEELVVSATAEDLLAVDGQPLEGEARLGPEHGPLDARVTSGDRHLAVLRREGLWAVRVFDPDAAARRAFAGIDAFDYAERWAVPAVFRPFPEGRTIQVANADGARRGLGLTGEVVFTVEGVEHTLVAGDEGDGSLWIVLADATSGRARAEGGSYRFRFLRPGAPGVDGRLTLDFNRTLLPPCAFTDHFLCPFPPPGNTLPFPLTAGERNPLATG
ncbi:DUF1684 domain-containing protein [Streptomyces buecherae]|uniref:DUF1684 domain-containing protein n=1 Tax=Streptomyces buecherae TaxID=2763006 RepID=A0A7H8N5C8_9ACTN|nr:DUF1684 domain-containing protein [Streptomyces buecherae]QKW49168.1 DUF1684 domain-containing protein [Streptomyces buecherae]